ncbi:hypothetical protein SAY87_008062 [Trapa incisa]|uniref:Uncharacterized protein n=1 Tax=Trapa incisa TaxID=236973 RepID=A0AAN7KN96_9MYRT|nr:hypothetical protein SAY87_008062 [Trapa incisa]
MVLFSLDTQDHHAALIAKGTYLIQSQESNHLFPCRKRIHQYYPIMASTLRLIIIAPLARLTLSSFREFIVGGSPCQESPLILIFTQALAVSRWVCIAELQADFI